MKPGMRSALATPLLLASALLLPLGASAQATSPDSNGSTGQYQQGQASIPARIKAEMAAQNLASAPGIDIESDATGSVVLSGTAATQADINKAMSIARGTTGVTSVRNEIKVRPRG